MRLSRGASEKEKKMRKGMGAVMTMRKSRVLYGWCYRCLLCYAPPTRGKYLYDTIRIQPGPMQACQIGVTLVLMQAGLQQAQQVATGNLQELRIFGGRLCPTVKEAPMSMCEQYVALGSGESVSLRWGSEVI